MLHVAHECYQHHHHYGCHKDSRAPAQDVASSLSRIWSPEVRRASTMRRFETSRNPHRSSSEPVSSMQQRLARQGLAKGFKPRIHGAFQPQDCFARCPCPGYSSRRRGHSPRPFQIPPPRIPRFSSYGGRNQVRWNNSSFHAFIGVLEAGRSPDGT